MVEITEILGYIGALLIGVVLGLVGGGGSILTVPVLVYVLGIQPVIATAYSLFVVGTTALVGAVQNLKKGLVDVRTAVIFAIPAFIGVYITRKYFVPLLPEVWIQIGSFTVTKDIGIMIFFAMLMLVAAFSMIKSDSVTYKGEQKNIYNYPLIIIEGLVVGVLTGIVGAGGGFLIIPALVLMAKLPMKKAVATSLLIITAKSLIGFIGDVENLEIDWRFLITFSAFSIVGMFFGIALSKHISGERLKKGFGWFVLLMGGYIIIKEIIN